MKATLEKLVQSGVSALICPRCGWWEGRPSGPSQGATSPAGIMDVRVCPDCNGWLDAVEPKR